MIQKRKVIKSLQEEEIKAAELEMATLQAPFIIALTEERVEALLPAALQEPTSLQDAAEVPSKTKVADKYLGRTDKEAVFEIDRELEESKKVVDLKKSERDN